MRFMSICIYLTLSIDNIIHVNSFTMFHYLFLNLIRTIMNLLREPVFLICCLIYIYIVENINENVTKKPPIPFDSTENNDYCYINSTQREENKSTYDIKLNLLNLL